MPYSMLFVIVKGRRSLCRSMRSLQGEADVLRPSWPSMIKPIAHSSGACPSRIVLEWRIAHGTSGSCAEYVRYVKAELVAIGIRDTAVDEFVRLVDDD
jgi:hypothetical protein